MKRSLTILCAAALLQCLSFTLTAGVANAARPKSANVSQAGIAQRLAGAAADAGSPAAATKAVLSVLKTLQIGVYDTRGRAIQRGAERGVRDLYLYDFEVKAIADALARHQTFGLANLGDLLSRVTGKQISAKLLGTVLRAAASPRPPASSARRRRRTAAGSLS